MEKLFVKDKPTLEGFPKHLLPLSVAQVLLDEGFHVLTRLDDRRVWLECSLIEMGEGTAERPDLGMEHHTLTLEVGIFGMHLMKHVLPFGRLPLSGVVYSGKTPGNARFMKELLAHCVCTGSYVSVNEEAVAVTVQTSLEEVFDCQVEVIANWHPVKKQISVFVKHPHAESFTLEFPDSINAVDTCIATASATLNRFVPCHD
ncbi:hypothetical protein GO755_30620 [Spirosoma sp. HMF4905]|uniref:Uncharacterized protein n=1 Tax=Spirosoma arboris TaxID=2682092 RepID=A0A7K1SKW8_9BACT|nr:hypothetical protein [Spirosoma arboris]MVM34425.1 hypothetical protein [Spirosoma arboris]